MIHVTALFSVGIFVCSPAMAERPQHDGKVVLIGHLHAHSKLSDDVSNAGDEMLPIAHGSVHM